MTLQEKLAAGRFVITAEVTPPVSAARGEFLGQGAAAAEASPTPSTSPTAPARARISRAVTAAAMLVEAGIEPILQFTCRDRNRIALQSDLIAPPPAACAIC